MSDLPYRRRIPIGMEQIADGVARFKKSVFPRRRLLFEHLAKAQAPKALFVTCTDSRIVPTLITRSNPGELFIERNPGNICPVYAEIPVGVPPASNTPSMPERPAYHHLRTLGLRRSQGDPAP